MWEDEKVNWLSLEKIGKLCNCGEIPKELISDKGDIPLYRVGTLGKQATEFISKEAFENYWNKYPYPKTGDVLMTTAGTVGRYVIFDGSPSYFQGGRIKWLENNEKIVLNKYLYYLYTEIKWENWEACQGQISHLSKETIYQTEIPCPRLEVQEWIIQTLEKFEALLNDKVSSLQAELDMRKKQSNYYMNKLMTFKELSMPKPIDNRDMPLFIGDNA